MDVRQEFLRIMDTQKLMALATSVDGQPDVRMIGFVYDKVNKVIYFVTYPKSPKVEQIRQNDKVAFTTLPAERIECVRGEGVARPSSRTLEEVAPVLEEKRPGYMEHIKPVRDRVALFEIVVDEVRVVLSDKKDHLLRV